MKAFIVQNPLEGQSFKSTKRLLDSEWKKLTLGIFIQGGLSRTTFATTILLIIGGYLDFLRRMHINEINNKRVK